MDTRVLREHRDGPIMPPGGQAHIQHVMRRTALVPHPYGQDELSRGGRGERPRDPIPSAALIRTNARGLPEPLQ